MTQATVQSGDSFEEYRVSETEEVDFDRVANPDLIRNPTFNQKRLHGVSKLSDNTLFRVRDEAFNVRRDCSLSGHTAQAVQSFWKKLRN